MLRIGLAPCSPFTVTLELMAQAAQLARRYKSGWHQAGLTLVARLQGCSGSGWAEHAACIHFAMHPATL
jgi:hypothetical protein